MGEIIMRIDDLPKDKGGSIAEFCDFPPIQLRPLEPRSLHGSYNMKFDPKPVMMHLRQDGNTKNDIVDTMNDCTDDKSVIVIDSIGGNENAY